MRSILLLLFPLCFFACRMVGGKRVTGNGNIIAQERSAGNFKEVSVSGPINVILQQGVGHTVKVESDENLMEYIQIETSGDRVRIDTKDGYNLESKKGINVYISAPQFTEIVVEGSGNLSAQNPLSGSSSLAVAVNGSGDIDLAVDVPRLEAKIGGSGTIKLRGTTERFGADVNGSGDIHGFDLLSERADVDIDGSGNARVYASKELTVDIAGSGNVSYKGMPKVQTKIAGSGNVNRAN